MEYHRIFAPGASYFFTITLNNRRSDLLIKKIIELRNAFTIVMQKQPFKLDGIVILPEHMHMIMTLPPEDSNYSQRIGFIKSMFSRQINPTEYVNKSRYTKRERGIWQRRFWEHLITNQKDYDNHMNYIINNPVKHGYVKSRDEWPYVLGIESARHNLNPSLQTQNIIK